MTSLRSRIIGLAVLACLVGASLPAAADGPRGPDRGYSPSFWQGLYAGVHVGHGEIGPLDGFAGGGLVGYNWQKGQIVYGWEADFSISDISFEAGGIEASIDWLATVRGRVGFLINPDFLAYATAGLGYAHVEVDVPLLGEFSDSGTDFVFGVGIEGKITPTMTLRGEYLNHGDLDIIRAGLTFKLSGY